MLYLYNPSHPLPPPSLKGFMGCIICVVRVILKIVIVIRYPIAISIGILIVVYVAYIIF